MNNMTVGMENLPNVFIDKIDVRPIIVANIVISFVITTKLCMYDHSPQRSWYKHGSLADLKIKFTFRAGEDAVKLNNGTMSLYDIDQFFVQIISAGDFEIEEEVGDYTKFSKIVEMEVPTIQNLNVYASCFMDGFSFDNELFNKFYGPMAAERIFIGGRINSDSGYFFYPDTNEEYGGPVHFHNNGYMEGSQHSVNPHKVVRYVQEDDYKIRYATFGEASDVLDPSLNAPVDVADQQGADSSQSNSLGDTGAGAEADAEEQGGASDYGGVLEGAEASGFDPTRPGFTDEELSALGEFRRSEGRIVGQDPSATSGITVTNPLENVSFEVRDAIRRGIY